MNERLRAETERLIRAWERHDAAWLDRYLVADVEDPRVNVASVLARQYLIGALWGERFRGLMEAELRWAVVGNWLLELRREAEGPEAWRAVAAALRRGADNAEGWPVPACIHRTAARLPEEVSGVTVPDYLGRFLARAGEEEAWEELADTLLGRWRAVLGSEEGTGRLAVFEPACGSANDYRSWEACGLARFLDYTGWDLCPKNVANARARFPAIRFETGNVFALPAADRAFDCGVVHDLFEHLSLEGLETAVGEVCRVTREALWVGCFQVDEQESHVVRPVEDYHLNTLSLARLLELFERHGFAGEAVHVASWLRLRWGWAGATNPQAYMLVLERRDGASLDAGERRL